MMGLPWPLSRATKPPDASRSVARAHRACVREIHATFEGTILALGQALELRDYETQGHTERWDAGTQFDPVVAERFLGLQAEHADRNAPGGVPT